MRVLITGGAGYIGSTVATACEIAGYGVVLLDDLSSGIRQFACGRPLYVGDIGDDKLLKRIVKENPDIGQVVHCAAKISVPESVASPISYYENNVGRGIQMLCSLVELGLDRIVFSSSASIYAASDDFTVDESSALAPASPYAQTKAMFETVLRDSALSGSSRAISLRYFNPIGADPGLRTGPHVREPSHALGKLMSAWRARAPFTITGVDWPTSDGTGLRDYIHVWDLARAHVAAIRRFDALAPRERPYVVFNVGRGKGMTVRELIRAFESVVGGSVDVIEGERRPGDTAGAYALTANAVEHLNWRAELGIDIAIRDALAWTARWNPDEVQ